MAKVLFFVQLIVGLVLPFWPGLEPRYALLGLLYLGLVVTLPFAAVAAVYGPRMTLRALADAWSPARLEPASLSAAAWSLAARTFPLAGVLGGLGALMAALSTVNPSRPWAGQMLVLVLFCLIWGFLGLLLGRILEHVVAGLSDPARPPLLELSLAVGLWFGLTPREVEAAQAVLDGLTYKDAAQRLGISPATAKSHLLSVYQKTGAGNKIELLRMVEAQTARIHQTVDGGKPVSTRT